MLWRRIGRMLRSLARTDRLFGVWMLAALACAGATRGTHEAATDPWAGCELHSLPGAGRSLLCSDYVVALLSPAKARGDDALDLLQGALAGYTGAPARPQKLRVDGREIPLRTLDDYVIAAPRPEISVICRPRAGRALELCFAVVEAIARDGLPPGVTFDERPQLYFLGRTLVVPDGCELVDAGTRIQCPATGAALSWQDAGNGVDPVRRSADVLARYLRAHERVLVQESVACSLVGRSGEGVRFAIDRPDHPDILVCTVVEAGFGAAAQCEGRLARGAAFPPPCDQVFEGTAP